MTVPKQGRRPVRGRTAAGLVLALCSVVTLGCGDEGATPPEGLRFGQIGSFELVLEVPLQVEEGRLVQTLRWGSSGAWSFQEAISYRGLTGDEAFRRNVGEPGLYAEAYARLVIHVNETQGLQLLGTVDQDVDPTCGPTRTRVRLRIVDEAKGEEAEWIRCADGSLANLTPAGAGPDPQASRVIQAVVLAAQSTLGNDFRSDYAGSVPFGTLDRGDDTPSNVRSPLSIRTQAAFDQFWADHAPSRPAPEVDFGFQMVVVGVTGERREAGDSVEVRRILQVDEGTLTHVVERVPGDFCSPAAQVHVPFHIVVAPKTPAPVRFAEITREEIPCG